MNEVGSDPITLALVVEKVVGKIVGGMFLLASKKVAALSKLFSYAVPPELFFDHDLLEAAYT